MSDMNFDAYINNCKQELIYDPKTGKVKYRDIPEEDVSQILKNKKVSKWKKIFVWLDFHIFSRFRK
jgi:hypothetical protein